LKDAELGDNASISDVTESLGGGEMGGLAGGGIGGVTSMLMGMVYPNLKSVLEASTRRITVVITWTEGARSYDIELVQWVTQPQPGPQLAAGAGGGGGGGPTPPPSNTTNKLRGPGG